LIHSWIQIISQRPGSSWISAPHWNSSGWVMSGRRPAVLS